MKKILIMMSCYNGQKYLARQIESILNQTDVDVKILVRDDGSTDNTMMILENYLKTNPEKFDIINGDNFGCTQSFFSLMETAAIRYPDYDYYAFSDQDDVWMPDKLICAVMALENANFAGKLYHCQPLIVDEILIPTGKKHLPVAKGLLGEAFIFQPCLGCTMVFNLTILKLAVKGKEFSPTIHDAWVYRMALAIGAYVVADADAHIYYRQHSSNVIGGEQSFLGKWKRRCKTYMHSDHRGSKEAKRILECYYDVIPAEQKKNLRALANYRSSLKSKMSILFSEQFRSSSRFHNFLFILAILFNKR